MDDFIKERLEQMNEEIAALNQQVKAAWEAYNSAAAAATSAALALLEAPEDKKLQLLHDVAVEEQQREREHYEGLKKNTERLYSRRAVLEAKLPGAVRRDFRVQYGSGREGLACRSYTTRRIHTCKMLYELISDRGYLLIKAPPQSGKTSTLELLSEWAGREHPSLDVVYVNLSHEGSGFQMNDVLRARVGGTLGEIMDGGNPVLVLIDEVQIAYHVERTGSEDFWNQIKCLEGGSGILTAAHQTRVVMAAAYGTSCSAADTAELKSHTATPVNVEYPDMVVTLFPSPSGASLQLSGAEWSELWDKFTGFTGLQLGDLIKDHIGSICSGQPGLLTACLDYLEDELVNELKAPEAVTRNAWYKLTSQGFLARLLLVRSIMKYADVERIPAAVDVMRQMLWVESLVVGFDGESAEAAAVFKLCRAGQLVLLEEHGLRRLIFTSPLHRASFLHSLYSGKCTASAEWTIDELITRAVERMDPAILQKIESLGSGDRRLERCWRMELYRVILDCLPHDRVVSPDVGRARGGRGFADLCISPPESSVLEATHDGKDMPEHLNRFLDPHKYEPLLLCGGVKQHAVIDFRSPGSATPRMQNQHLYTVVCQPAFAEAVIHHMGGQQLVRVAGRADDATRSALAAALQWSTDGQHC